MEDISVAKLLMEILDDEEKTQILNFISDDLYGEDLLDRLLGISQGE
ncbi:MAG: hypothetical protein PHG64_11770 [Paludibacter sp.]|nr:hypothetical protein [Paludibacter sp.]